MNQPEVRIKYEKCLECNKKIAMRYHYDRHLSDWVCYEIPLCDECKYKEIASVDSKDCRDCKKWNDCECGKKGHDKGTSIGYSVGECAEYEVTKNE